jgi:transcriptional regulator of acetoin/glycerol metabolism
MAMKRRLLDCLQTSDQSLSRDTSNPLFKTQKISFKMFQQKETIHMKSLYPFLTKTQINSKVRQLWKNMSGADKKNFNKVVLTKTPTKSLNIAKQIHKKGNNAPAGPLSYDL